MEVTNSTPFEIETLPMKGPEGNPFLVIIVKGTFDIRPDDIASVSSEQMPVAFGDEVYDEKEGGSVKFESDIVPFKPRGDIVLVGRAYAPGGAPAESVDVSLRLGNVSKAIRVIGDRHWEFSSRLFPVIASDPELFKVIDLIYERAFGGIDTKGGGWCEENPLGRGFYGKKNKEVLDGAPLPNLEDPKNLIEDWDDHPKPVGFGFYSRAAMPRSGYLGTYDEKWQKERSPDPPEDFRFDYYNGAHPDLQVEGYLKGDEGVELINLTPEGKVQFQLPGTRLSCAVTKSDGPGYERENVVEEGVNLNLDTTCFIPDEGRFYMVWRGLCPVKNLMAMEVVEVNVTEL
ncbi:DUF2169 domain-containing protein [Candidatus Poribacteria bacterium]